MRLRLIGILLSVSVPLAGAGSATSAPSWRSDRAAAGIPGIENMSYKPTPAIEMIPVQPDPAAVESANPTGEYNAYDLNVFETIHFPERQAGDESADDPPGGAISHGTCPEGGCPNHGLEFKRFWLKTMKPLVKPLGGFVRSHKFESAGNNVPPYVFAAPPGIAHNLHAVVPGATHPEQMVIVSGHYDQTDSGPASAWDSAEGHATVVRIAKIMTDYWLKTGTRPSATVKFSAWAAEEAGSHGSQAYIRDRIAPFPNLLVNGYFNLDPCGGAYPAFYRGNPTDRTPMVMQLANPERALSQEFAKRMKAFNKQARVILGDVFNHLDDNLTDVPTAPPIFVSDEEAEKEGIDSQEDEIVTAVGGLALFTSDYRNFERIGVPILNLFPDYFGPHADGTAGRDDGIAILHSPNDNLKTLNALTGVDQSGLTPSEGWYKGLEFCAHLHGWFMLQPNMGGAEQINGRPVAYFEALKRGAAPIRVGDVLRFKAHGSYARPGNRILPRKRLRYRWTFGDGKRGRGFVVKYAFEKAGIYKVRLRVIAPNDLADSMTLLVRIEP